MSFNKTLSSLERLPSIEIECVEGFFITCREAGAHSQEFRSRVAEYQRGIRKSKSGNKRKVSFVKNPDSISGTNDPVKDAEFFYDVFVITWRGLKNDAGMTVKPSRGAAVELFSSKNGMVLLNKILLEVMKEDNFVQQNLSDEEDEIAKES